jgi:hypothetical protein
MWSVYVTIALLIGVVLGTLAGCVDLDQVRKERERGAEVVSTLKARGAEYQSTLIGLGSALPESDPARAELVAELQAGLKRVELARDEVERRVQQAAKLEEDVRRSRTLRAKSDDRVGGSGRLGEVTEGVGAVGGGGGEVTGDDLLDLIPGPWKVAAVLTVGLATSLVRSRQLREAASSIARSIDKALEEDAKLAERFRQHASTLRTIQTPLAKKIVDEGQQ